MSTNPPIELILFIIIIAALLVLGWYAFQLRRKEPQSNAYLEALEYLADGNERLAIQKFKEAIRQDTENVDGYIRLGDLLRKRGMINHALRIHRDLTLRTNLTPAQKLRVYQSLLLDYEGLQDYENGVKIAQKILELNRKTDEGIAFKLLDMLEKSQKWDEAYETAKKFSLNKNPRIKQRMALYLLFQGLELQEEGKGREARVKFKEALKHDPQCAAAYYYLGKSYELEERLNDAITEWVTLCDKIPEKAHIVFPELERTWFDLGRFTDAENLYQELLRKNPRNLEAALSLAEIYRKKGEFDDALEILERTSEYFEDSPRLVAKKVSLHFERGQYKQASTQALNFFEKKYLLSQPIYQCQQCDYQSNEPLWLCPQCKSIDSFNI